VIEKQKTKKENLMSASQNDNPSNRQLVYITIESTCGWNDYATEGLYEVISVRNDAADHIWSYSVRGLSIRGHMSDGSREPGLGCTLSTWDRNAKLVFVGTLGKITAS
jgi:hypothetical protein